MRSFHHCNSSEQTNHYGEKRNAINLGIPELSFYTLSIYIYQEIWFIGVDQLSYCVTIVSLKYIIEIKTPPFKPRNQ